MIAKLFSDLIQQDVLVGAKHEVYRICNETLKNENVVGISVVTNSNDVICSVGIFSSEKERVVKEFIFYDPTKNELAATVQIAFSNEMVKSIFKVFLGLIIITLLGFVSGSYYIAYRIGRNLSKPLEDLNIIMNSIKSAEDKIVLSKPDLGKIIEYENLFYHFDSMVKSLINLQEKTVYLLKKDAIAVKARQVAHDIRSPLAALETIRSNFHEKDLEGQIFVSAIDRISEIVQDLSHHKMSTDKEKFKSADILKVINSIISEKKIQMVNKIQIHSSLIEEESLGLAKSVLLNIAMFKRAISNLINNSLEASVFNSDVDIKVICSELGLIIIVADNGVGIPDGILERVFDENFTHEKVNGTGLGLFQVKQFVDSHDGIVSLSSAVGVGTEIRMDFPWFFEKNNMLLIPLSKEGIVYLVDDDSVIHDVLKDKIRKKEPNIIVKSYYSIESFKEEISNIMVNDSILIDISFSEESLTGLELVIEQNLGEKAVIISSQLDNPELIKICEQKDLRYVIKDCLKDIEFVVK